MHGTLESLTHLNAFREEKVMPEDSKVQIAYVPFNTFSSAIDGMEHTLPPRLDKSMWPNYSGAIQSQLWSAFRFFDLVRDDGTPTERLVKLVKDKANRKAQLRQLLEEKYPTLIALDLSKATLGHFNDAMRLFGLGTETQKKASSFFLQAAKAAEIPLSRFILSNTRTPGTRKKRSGKVKGNGDGAGVPLSQYQIPPPTEGIPVKTVTLENGITLSLSASADTFRMTSADRKWVNALLETLETYESEHMGEDDELDGAEEEQS
jgi:hypothetical protein